MKRHALELQTGDFLLRELLRRLLFRFIPKDPIEIHVDAGSHRHLGMGAGKVSALHSGISRLVRDTWKNLRISIVCFVFLMKVTLSFLSMDFRRKQIRLLDEKFCVRSVSKKKYYHEKEETGT
jgi:hypothetical protein